MPSLGHPHVAIGDVTPVGSVSVLGANKNINPTLPGFTASIRYYSNATGTPATPGAGIVTISATGLASNQDTTITDGALDSTDVTNYVNWKHHCTKVTATPVGVTTATHYQLFVVQEP